jgi:hypothetical protein
MVSIVVLGLLITAVFLGFGACHASKGIEPEPIAGASGACAFPPVDILENTKNPMTENSIAKASIAVIALDLYIKTAFLKKRVGE